MNDGYFPGGRRCNSHDEHGSYKRHHVKKHSSLCINSPLWLCAPIDLCSCMAIVETTAINAILTVRNPSRNAAALTITPLACGTRPVSAHLVITQLQ